MRLNTYTEWQDSPVGTLRIVERSIRITTVLPARPTAQNCFGNYNISNPA
jgi:hypothetical protein